MEALELVLPGKRMGSQNFLTLKKGTQLVEMMTSALLLIKSL